MQVWRLDKPGASRASGRDRGGRGGSHALGHGEHGRRLPGAEFRLAVGGGPALEQPLPVCSSPVVHVVPPFCGTSTDPPASPGRGAEISTAQVKDTGSGVW